MRADCIKKTNRSIFELFKIYSCHHCTYYQEDEIIKIGYQNMYLFPIQEKCEKEVLSIEEICFSKRVRLFLKDAILHPKITILWLDTQEYEQSFSIFPVFLGKEDLAILYE